MRYFSAVDHHIILRHLYLSFGLTDSVIFWLNSFIHDRTVSVRFASVATPPRPTSCGVPQGSVLGPLLFIMYVADVIPLVKRFSFDAHMFTDDLQIYASCRPPDASQLSSSISCALDAVISWCRSNHLLLNSSKSEVMWCSSLQRKSSIPTSPVYVG